MLTSDDFSTYVADLLSGTYDCVDRISVRGYFPLGQTSGGLLTWWNKLFPNTALSEQRLRKLAGDFARRVHASARKHKIPLRYFVIGDKTKHAQAEKLRPLDPKFRFILPSGQSGRLFSPHFNDQTDLWRSGRRISMARAENDVRLDLTWRPDPHDARSVPVRELRARRRCGPRVPGALLPIQERRFGAALARRDWHPRDDAADGLHPALRRHPVHVERLG